MADFINEPIVDEGLGAEVDVGVEPVAEIEGPLGSKLSLTADDIPELADLQPGDSISFTIDDITDDGNYALTVSPAEIAEAPLPDELPAEEPALGGQDAVLDQLVG